MYRRTTEAGVLFVGVYVDDLVITGTDEKEIENFKEQMHQLFDMSDLGLLSYYLGIEVKHREGVITLCQSTMQRRCWSRQG